MLMVYWTAGLGDSYFFFNYYIIMTILFNSLLKIRFIVNFFSQSGLRGLESTSRDF